MPADGSSTAPASISASANRCRLEQAGQTRRRRAEAAAPRVCGRPGLRPRAGRGSARAAARPHERASTGAGRPRRGSRAADTEHPAERLDWMVDPLRSDEPKDTHRLPLSLTKKATAFIKISRSSSSTFTRRRSRRSSSRSSPLSDRNAVSVPFLRATSGAQLPKRFVRERDHRLVESWLSCRSVRHWNWN